ncbi:MAG: hypothetical protein QM758_17050 [Armatimonas sp.]
MDRTAPYRVRLVLVNLILMLMALGLASIGSSLYLTPKSGVAMAIGSISLLLGGTLLFSFSSALKYLVKGELDREKLKHIQSAFWVNAVVNVGMPLGLTFLGSDGLRLLGTPAVPLFFRLTLGIVMLDSLLCSVLLLHQYFRLARTLKG